MSNLKVTREWFSWFRENRIEAITTIDNKEVFEHIIRGELVNHDKTYETIFYLLDCFKAIFNFLEINEIRLEHTEEIAKNSLQFFYKGENYIHWKNKAISIHKDIIPEDYDYEDRTDVHYNYYLQHEQRELLYKLPPYDNTQIYLWGHQDKTLKYAINMEMRKILFFHDSHFEFNLPEEILEHNHSLLSNATANLKKMIDNIS